jgi:uncharacterized Tic20 family protein
MTTALLDLSLPTPTQDERTNALLVHVLAIFSGFLAPLVFYLVKRDSKFVAFHALQVLIWHAAYMVTFSAGMMVLFASMFLGVPARPDSGANQAPPLAFFGLFGFVWLFGMSGWVVNLILGIVFAIKANQGEWARYPLIGSFVLRKILPGRPIS